MKKLCESCGGSGQIQYFKGVSRFLLSTEECPECAGMGYIFTTPQDTDSLESENENQYGWSDNNQEK